MTDIPAPTTATDRIAAYEARALETPWVDTQGLTRAVGLVQRSLGEPIKLSFVGNFSVGKSNIINSLLGAEVAPVGVRRTTAVICRFRYGEEVRLRIHFRDGRVEEGELLAFKRFSDHTQMGADEEAHMRSMAFVEIFYPSEALRNITLVDTPGFGSEAELDDQVTIGHLQEADAVCWVFDAQEVGKSDEVRRVKALAPNFRAAFAVVNKCDEKPASERPKLAQRVEDLFEGCFEAVLLYSAELVREQQEDPEMVDEEETAHLCMDLRGEIARRVKANADLLRARHAEAALVELARGHREEAAVYVGQLERALTVFEASLPLVLDRRRRKLLRDAEEERQALSRRLSAIPTRHLARFERCLDVDRRLFKQNVSLNEQALDALWKDLEDAIHEAFSPWHAFVGEVAARTTDVINTVELGDVFVDNRELAGQLEQLVDKLRVTVQHWSEFIPAVLHLGPLNRALGSVDGFVRTLYGMRNVEPVLQELAALKGPRLARFVTNGIDPAHPLEIVDGYLSGPEGASPWIVRHIDDIDRLLADKGGAVRDMIVQAMEVVVWLDRTWLVGEDVEALTVERTCVGCGGETAVGYPAADPSCQHCGARFPAWPMPRPEGLRVG